MFSFVWFSVMLFLAVGLPIASLVRERNVMRDFIRRAEWEQPEWDWLAQTMTARWRGMTVAWQRFGRGWWLMWVERPGHVALRVVRRADLVANLNVAFRSDALKIDDSAFRFYGEDEQAARALERNEDIALAMHKVLRSGAELIITPDMIKVQASRYASFDNAWQLLVALATPAPPAD